MTSLNPCPLVSLKTKGLFTWREEDPRRQGNLTLGLLLEILVCVVPKKERFEKELKMMGNKYKNAILSFLLSFLALINPFSRIITIISLW